MVNILENNNYINKCMTRNGTQNKKKYFENNIINNSKYNQNNNSRVYSMNGSKAKSNVVIIGGIAYRMTRNKLTKKLPQKEVSKVKPNYSSISTSTLLPSKELLNNNNNNNNIENTTKMIEKQKIVNNCNVSNDSNNNHKCKVLLVRGIKYEMDANGKTLRQVASNGHHLRGSDGRLSRLDIGGVTYRCSKPGLFISTNAERVRQLRNRAIKSSINRILLAKRNKTYLKQMPKKHCIFYCRFGRCNEGVNCPFIHDKDKIAVCSRYIRGTCKASDCLFSHSVAPEKLPVCSFFLEGRCSSDCCPYPHVKVNSDADICKRFLCGYCPKGVQCKSAHVFVCIEFNRNGKCAKGDTCPLPHTRLGSVVAKKKRKLKTCVNFKNAKPLLDFNKDSQSQPLPSYIPLSTDNDFSSDDNSPLNVDKTDSNSCDLPSVHRKDKIQYFWVESDDENSHSNTDSDDNEENACRPTIRIIPKFLFD